MSVLEPARAIADVDSGLILASVEVAASPDRVFKALCSEEITDWWRSEDGYRITFWSADPVIGGKWKSIGKRSDGQEFEIDGEVLEIDPPHKLVQSWKAGRDEEAATTLLYRLEEVEVGTRLTITHTGFSRHPDSCRRQAKLWEQMLGRLAGHLNPRNGGTVYVCKLVGPRPTFPGDMTEAERGVMNDHVIFWLPRVQNGTVIVFGPVGEPGCVCGLGLIRAADPQALAALLAEDPAIKSGLGFSYETAPMLGGGSRH